MSEADFGVDLWCEEDLDPGLKTATGFTLVQQAMVGRLSTPRGMVIDDENYGVDLTSFMSGKLDSATLVRMRSAALGQVMKDDRVQNVRISVTSSGRADQKAVAITITGDFLEAPFALTLAVDEVSVTVMEDGGTGL